MLRLASLEFVGIEIPKKILRKLDRQTEMVFVFLFFVLLANMLTDLLYTLALHSEQDAWLNRFWALVLPIHVGILLTVLIFWFIMHRCETFFPGATFFATAILTCLKYEQWTRVYDQYADIAPSY